MKSFSLLSLCILLSFLGCSPEASDGDADADADADEDVECDPEVVSCDGNLMQQCNSSGDGWAEEQLCEGATGVCVDEIGCLVCRPGNRDCEENAPLICNADGTAWDRGEPCDTASGQQCVFGHCTDPCAGIDESNSYVGCEYWAVDLSNAQQESGLSPENANFAVVISNGHPEATATVEVFGNGDDATALMSIQVPPNDLRTLEINPTIAPAETNISGTGVHRQQAYHIVSNLPVTAYQFNPLNNTEQAYSNDASLLLPVNGLDTDYIAATADGIVGGDNSTTPPTSYNWGAFVTVVAITDGTEVTVTPTNEIIAGGDLAGGTDDITVTLDAFDVLNVESLAEEASVPGHANLSGSYVHASAPVAVFSGNVATVMPNAPDGDCCADHLEEQLIPLSAWGQQFVVGRGEGRRREGDWEPEFYRITGGNVPPGQDVINLSYHPEPPEGAPSTLTEGESVEFSSTTDFIVEGDGPLMVTSFFVSSQYSAPEYDGSQFCITQAECNGLAYAAVCVMATCAPIGDPSMTIIPPVEQFRDSYVFLAPNDYQYDAITVIAPMGASITLDGAPLGAMTLVGDIDGTSYGVVRSLVGDGTHRLQADGGTEVGLIVYGMDRDVSYGYPGGLDLEVINII